MSARDVDRMLEGMSSVLADPVAFAGRVSEMISERKALVEKIKEHQQLAHDNEVRGRALGAREQEVVQREREVEAKAKELEAAKQMHGENMTVEQSKLAKAQADHQAKIDAEQSLLAAQWEKLNDQTKALAAKEKDLRAQAAKLDQRDAALDDREAGVRRAQSDLSTRITRMREVIGN